MFKYLVNRGFLCFFLQANATILDAKKQDEGVANNLDEVLSSQLFLTTGESTFSLLFWDLYRGKLQTTSGRYPIAIDKDELIFNIHYFTAISSKELIKRTIEQWQHLSISPKKYLPFIKALQSIWPNIDKGDNLSMLMQKNKSVFYFNKHYIGTIDNAYFGQLFIDIWLSKKTSQPSFRAELLGESVNDIP